MLVLVSSSEFEFSYSALLKFDRAKIAFKKNECPPHIMKHSEYTTKKR